MVDWWWFEMGTRKENDDGWQQWTDNGLDWQEAEVDSDGK